VTAFSEASAKIGKVKPETLAIAHEIFDAAQSDGHDVWYLWGYDGDVGNTEHHSGLAVDFMIHNHTDGQAVRDYIWRNRERLRLRHVIWEQHITSTVVSPGVVRLMGDRGDTTANHMDHVHALFDAGTYRTPVGYNPPPSSPSPSTPNPTDDKHLTVDGDLGPKTIRRWQEIMGTTADGVIDRPSELVSAVQRKLRGTVDHTLVVDGVGIFQDGRFYKTIGALQRYLKSPVDGVMSPGFSNCVAAVQRRLNDGWF
jgi:peptidoglycan hydrolase-like protein with peptidoglycan-binding domain